MRTAAGLLAMTGLLLAACADRDAAWVNAEPDAADRAMVKAEIREIARPPLIGLAFMDPIALQCLQDGRLRLILDEKHSRQNMPRPDFREVVLTLAFWQTHTIRVEREPHSYSIGPAYRFVADTRSEPRLAPLLAAMGDHYPGMKRTDILRKPRYRLNGPRIEAFVSACKPPPPTM